MTKEERLLQPLRVLQGAVERRRDHEPSSRQLLHVDALIPKPVDDRLCARGPAAITHGGAAIAALRVLDRLSARRDLLAILAGGSAILLARPADLASTPIWIALRAILV